MQGKNSEHPSYNHDREWREQFLQRYMRSRDEEDKESQDIFQEPEGREKKFIKKGEILHGSLSESKIDLKSKVDLLV